MFQHQIIGNSRIRQAVEKIEDAGRMDPVIGIIGTIEKKTGKKDGKFHRQSLRSSHVLFHCSSIHIDYSPTHHRFLI